MSTESSARKGQSIWVVPGVALAIGVAYLAAGIIGGDVAFGVNGMAIMTIVAVLLLALRGRSETIRGILDQRDERISAIDARATAFAGGVVIAVVLCAFVVDIARGGNGFPYAVLAAVGGVAYVSAVMYHRVRG